MTATAWTVFKGSKPEAMEVEILGVLHGARGPGQDMILVQLHGAKPEYTGVVAGMSGSPVYIGDKLLGSLSYRIGEFSKDPIAGITPIEQMLEVRDLPLADQGTGIREQGSENRDQGPGIRDQRPGGPVSAENGAITANGMNFEAMETPLVMSGFRPEAIRLWQERMAGTGLEMVAAGGIGGSSRSGLGAKTGGKLNTEISPAALATVAPGSAVSAQLVRGDLEISATCTVTYIDPKQLLACGHPILQAGPVSLPMTTADVVATLASPLNAFKIVNTGDTIGAFTEDRDSAIRGVLGQKARMIPVHVTVHGAGAERKLNIEVLDLPSLTSQAVLVALYESLMETNESTAETSYHLTGSIDLEGYPASPLDLWASAGGSTAAPLQLALMTGVRFSQIYSNGARLRHDARNRFAGRSHPTRDAGGAGDGEGGLERHCARGRHGDIGGNDQAVAPAGPECAHSRQAAGEVERGKPAAVGIGCRDAGPDFGSTTDVRPPGRAGNGARASAAATPGRSYLREPAGA